MNPSLKKSVSYLTRLISRASYLKGNTVTMKRVCGNKNCRCQKLGLKHESMYLAKKQNNTTRMIYIPRRLEDEVALKVRTYHRIKELIDKISDANYQEIEKKKKGDV